jgi:hypothetical protein
LGERAFAAAAARLRATPGPTLFEDIHLGNVAGKVLEFDPPTGRDMMLGQALPEEYLISRLRNHYFRILVVDTELESAVAAIKKSRAADPASASRAEAMGGLNWTDNVALAMDRYYRYLPGSEYPCRGTATCCLYVPKK